MKRFLFSILVVALLSVGLSGSRCLAEIWMDPGDVLSGTLAWNLDEIIAGDGWAATGTTFEYTVSRDPVDLSAPLHYLYTFTVPEVAGALSHLIIEASDAVEGGLGAFTLGFPDYLNGPDPGDGAILVGSYGPGGDNPGIPAEGMYGIKFEDMFDEESSSWTVEFDSYRLPMWGDFYAKDGVHGGEWAFAYNSGFGLLNGAMILVPNTSYVPVPGAILLGMLGLGVAGWRLRRFT